MLVGAEEVLYAVVSAVVEEVEEPAEVVSAVTDNARVREGGGRGGSSLRKGVDLSHGSGDGGRMTGKTGIGLERQDLTGTQDRAAVVVSGVVLGVLGCIERGGHRGEISVFSLLLAKS
jgi:hypothetical protein